MWKRTYSKTFQGVKESVIWKIWTDVNRWTDWHGDLDYCKMEGDFVIGNTFLLKPKGVNPVKIELVEIKPGESFTDCTRFPGAKMYDTHAMKQSKNGLELTNTLWVTGPLKWMWIFLVAKNVAQSMPDEVEALVQLARAYDK